MIAFPVYRKYPHNRTYFKIYSETEFEEIQLIGKYYQIQLNKATILPDRNFIYDMLHDYQNNWIEISAEEYVQFFQQCQKNLTEIKSS